MARHLDEPIIFLSTNSRSLDEAAAAAVTRDAVMTAGAALRAAGRPASFVSRGDSTLRGHFPAETMAVADAAGLADARFLLAPYFGEGGRVTIDDVHQLERDGLREPVAATEFAHDAVFGYRSSDLHAWVAEKYAAAARPAPPTVSLSLDLVRGGGPAAVAEALRRLPAGAVAIANAEVDADIEVTALGALMAEEDGMPLVARTAASYVRARAGQRSAPLLAPGELGVDGPGLVIVGSHVAATTRQLEHLLESIEPDRLVVHELRVGAILSGGAAAIDEIGAAAEVLNAAAADGRIGIVATERARRDVGLEGARALSSALVAVVQRVDRRPGWVIAKGGITSYDVASRGLGMREARVAGQLLAGVPVWIGSEGSRWPGMPLVVFPGNVGDRMALADAIDALTG